MTQTEGTTAGDNSELISISDYVTNTTERLANLIEWEGELRHLEPIAAEIERLTAEVASKQETIDMLLEDERDAFRHERAQLETQLAKARAEVARRTTPARRPSNSR